MKPFVIIDIETVENDRAKELYSRKKYEADGRLKDPLKIEQSIMEKRQKDLDKSPLYWWTGKVICICANVLGANEKAKTFIGDDERELFHQFFGWLSDLQKRWQGFTLIAKSGDYFDIPFLTGRCLALDLGVPNVLRGTRGISDIDHIFSWSSQCDQRSSLDNYAFGLNIAGKNGHGSDVAPLYNMIQMGDTDQWKKIADYCAQDTNIATEILRRYLKQYVNPNVTTDPIEPMKAEDIPFG